MFRQLLTASAVIPRSFVRSSVIRQSSSAAANDEPLFDMENPFEKEKQQCLLCRLKITPDYKNVKLLSQFQSPYTGRIYGKHITGLCETQQKLVEAEIMKAQAAGLMATYLKEPCYLKDPKLFDTDNPIRPHRF
ncbi:hypothetical protein Zmor_025926 [Zophobas morio]|uniref:28S ribosomal protein S18c, mitochondrial n=1 Tax=Zophobas morio TaxID=2755281 RepID=A0AA38HU52_9CUCU|nr:hypothetical protein Zmor_025926 [Zophobas morio]